MLEVGIEVRWTCCVHHTKLSSASAEVTMLDIQGDHEAGRSGAQTLSHMRQL